MHGHISIIHNRKKTNSVRVVTMGLTKVIDILVWENWKKYKCLTKKEKSSAPPFASNSNISIKSLISQKHGKTGSENLKPIGSYYSTQKYYRTVKKSILVRKSYGITRRIALWEDNPWKNNFGWVIIMKFKLQGSQDLWSGLYNLQIYIYISEWWN